MKGSVETTRDQDHLVAVRRINVAFRDTNLYDVAKLRFLRDGRLTLHGFGELLRIPGPKCNGSVHFRVIRAIEGCSQASIDLLSIVALDERARSANRAQ
jgi:hypothetical protein